jgi:hypothetical protein
MYIVGLSVIQKKKGGGGEGGVSLILGKTHVGSKV